jgi:hypothetical protein
MGGAAIPRVETSEAAALAAKRVERVRLFIVMGYFPLVRVSKNVRLHNLGGACTAGRQTF